MAIVATYCQFPGCNAGVHQGFRYCTRRHGRQAAAAGSTVKTTLLSSKLANMSLANPFSLVQGSSSSVSSGVRSICQLSGCNLAVFVESGGRTHDFCGKTHARLGRTSLNVANRRARGGGRICCSASGCNKLSFVDGRGKVSAACSRRHKAVSKVARGPDFELCLVESTHVDSKLIKKQFAASWKSTGGTPPKVAHIFKVIVPDKVFQVCKAYAHRVGNKRRRFHGTRRSPTCNFFLTLAGNPCYRSDCKTCSICTKGFISPAYGKGIFSSATSSKADWYASTSEQFARTVMFGAVQSHSDGKRYKSMFVCTVAAGHNILKTCQVNVLPPPGTTAVVGDVGQGLANDELVVHDNAAILPTHIIVYTAN